jgi:hypothetical protein
MTAAIVLTVESVRRRGIASDKNEMLATIASAAASPHANAFVSAAAPRIF